MIGLASSESSYLLNCLGTKLFSESISQSITPSLFWPIEISVGHPFNALITQEKRNEWYSFLECKN